ncbi:AMP-binding protein [Uliginosibacterium sp. TH139]|uniref:AMP-binding protein n=1 Tax=Uliginosibacterium sp. TH139 TaxID=2067453 RepID=UPI000C7B84BF|nr:AMP-binding protein [Uliginosibacterium sp. TH139]PLK47903.1 AMP-dependent synthetase [Uliginosibacterium sp. TH139]
MSSLPLLPPAPVGHVLALHAGRAISQDEFLSQVLALAAALPAGRPLLNLCNDRYHFALGLFAAIAHGNLSLLPNSTAPENIAALHAAHPDLLCLSDQQEPPFGLPTLRITAPEMATATPSMPQIPAEQVVACVFTSGSTGQPQPHIKTFGRLFACAQAEARRIWATTGGPCAVLGTVPFQHMYGLESTVLLPIFGGGILCGERPFFPADVASALADLPAPRFLVTTPFHLRNLLDAEIALPPLAALLSATAPLATELATRAEAQLGAPLLEIYGSTETGQIATRRTTAGPDWALFEGLRLEQEGDYTWADGAFLELRQQLGDVLELLDEGHFRLIGRHADMINIAGKRSSLAYLNHILCKLPGVRDAAFCLPDESEAGRLAAFVVAPGLTTAELIKALRPHLDPLFLPRPIVFLEHLPRNATGKIPAAEMQALIEQHLKARA